MTEQSKSKMWPDFRFNLEEISGAVGDYGTLFPIVLGAAIVSHVNLGHVLLFFSIWYIITGFWYKMPVPVEPMKAIGAVVIALGLSSREIAASGMLLGALFLILGFCRGMKWIQKRVPKSVIRGVQAGLALILFKTSFPFVAGNYILSTVCIIAVILFLIANTMLKIPDISALVLLAIGIGVGFVTSGIPRISIMPLPGIIIPTVGDFVKGGWLLAIPQVPLTITNAILSTSLLMQDLVSRQVDPDALSKSIGLMNLTSVPFGGFPMCHGAGGLAAQYRFGARTGGSNIISGLILLPIALFFASTEFVNIIPTSVFGVMLIFVALELGKHSLKTGAYVVVGIMGITALLSNITVAFILGIILEYLFKYWKARKT